MLVLVGCILSDQCIDDIARALPSFEYLEEISLKGESHVFFLLLTIQVGVLSISIALPRG
jgi:hypothetical protein